MTMLEIYTLDLPDRYYLLENLCVQGGDTNMIRFGTMLVSAGKGNSIL